MHPRRSEPVLRVRGVEEVQLEVRIVEVVEEPHQSGVLGRERIPTNLAGAGHAIAGITRTNDGKQQCGPG